MKDYKKYLQEMQEDDPRWLSDDSGPAQTTKFLSASQVSDLESLLKGLDYQRDPGREFVAFKLNNKLYKIIPE